MKAQKTVAVILAGGVGQRFGSSMPKQLLKIAGKSIIDHTFIALNASKCIDEIIIMMHPERIEDINHLKNLEDSKLSMIIPGGSTRNETSQLALKAITGNPKVLFHDAVRPFLDNEIITKCVEALDDYEAVDTAIPSADTIIKVGSNNCIDEIPDRSLLMRGQTPQGFWANTLRKAYTQADKDPHFSATDDCGVIFKYLPEIPIKVIPGSPENIKITDPVDIHIADKIFQLRSATIAGPIGDQESLAKKTIIIFGGSYGIGAEIKSVAQSLGAKVFSFSRSENMTDINKIDSIVEALQYVYEKIGRIDHVILTAGVLNIQTLEDSTPQDITQTLTTNLLSPALIAQESLKYLKKTQGSFTFFTSSSYTRGRAGYALYSATKAGIVNLTQALSEEWQSDNVRVNAINPQRTQTPMRIKAFGEEAPETLLSPTTVAEETVKVIISNLTGQIINVRK